MGNRFIKSRLTVSETDWTPVVAPADMDYFAVRCDAVSLLVRTDVADANTEDTIPATIQDGVMGSNSGHWVLNTAKYARFLQGETVCSIKRATGSGSVTVIVTWVR